MLCYFLVVSWQIATIVIADQTKCFVDVICLTCRAEPRLCPIKARITRERGSKLQLKNLAQDYVRCLRRRSNTVLICNLSKKIAARKHLKQEGLEVLQ